MRSTCWHIFQHHGLRPGLGIQHSLVSEKKRGWHMFQSYLIYLMMWHTFYGYIPHWKIYIYIHLIERFSYADFWTSLWLCRWVTDLKSKNLKTTFLRYSTVCCVQKFDGQNSHLTNHIFSQWPVLFMVKSSCFPANWPNGYKVMSHFQLVYATPSNKKCNHHKLTLFAFDIRQLSY